MNSKPHCARLDLPADQPLRHYALIEFTEDLPLRQQLESGLAAITPNACPRHPHESLPLRLADPIEAVLSRVHGGCQVIFDRCPTCPYNSVAALDQEAEGCAASWWKPESPREDEMGRPFPTLRESIHLAPDQPPAKQFADGIDALKVKGNTCRGQTLAVRHSSSGFGAGGRLELPLTSDPCPLCALERLGFTPDEAHATFANFVCEPANLLTHLEICQSFAADPRGLLALLGNTGTGKTHLAAAMARALLARGVEGLVFIRSRDFFADHFRSLLPVRFDQAPPRSPLARCQSARILILDEFKAPSTNITMSARIAWIRWEFGAAASAGAEPSHQPRLHRVERPFPRQPRSFF